MFNSPFDIRVNTVNCVGVMGAGVALAFKRRYPEMFLAYKKACEVNEVRPGELYIWKKNDNDWIVNFPTKRDWRGKSRYHDIASGLLALRKYLEGLGKIKIALPALGCGNGGLDWNVVLPMIVKELEDLEAEVHVFEPENSRKIGQQALLNEINHSLLELGDYGFGAAEFFRTKDQQASRFFIKADWNPFAYRWISLFPSKDLSDREIEALNSIAVQLHTESGSIAVVLLYKVRSSLEVVEIFSKNRINVILILPFGPLSNMKLARDFDNIDSSRVAVISFSEPKQKWSNMLGISANNFIFENATGALLSDPSSEVINEVNLKRWRYDPFVFVRYRDHSTEALEFLSKNDLRPIGRRPETGELNLLPLLSAKNKNPITDFERIDIEKVQIISYYKLNKIFNLLKGFESKSYEISFSIKTESKELKILIEDILGNFDVG